MHISLLYASAISLVMGYIVLFQNPGKERGIAMANQEHLDILKQGMEIWNKWRKENRDIRPDLRGADLSASRLSSFNLIRSDLSEADLSKSNLSFARLSGSDLQRANLSEAVLITTVALS